MADLGLLDLFLRAKTPEEVRDGLVKLLLDPAAEITPEMRRQLAEMMQGGHHGFELRVARTTKNRPSTDTLRNVAIHQAINDARYRKRVGDQTGELMEWREKAALSESEWREIIDGVISRHNANCEPDDRWQPLNDQKAREQAFRRGHDAEMAYRSAQEELED